jgi:hypothetical protein
LWVENFQSVSDVAQDLEVGLNFAVAVSKNIVVQSLSSLVHWLYDNDTLKLQNRSNPIWTNLQSQDSASPHPNIGKLPILRLSRARRRSRKESAFDHRSKSWGNVHSPCFCLFRNTDLDEVESKLTNLDTRSLKFVILTLKSIQKKVSQTDNFAPSNSKF